MPAVSIPNVIDSTPDNPDNGAEDTPSETEAIDKDAAEDTPSAKEAGALAMVAATAGASTLICVHKVTNTVFCHASIISWQCNHDLLTKVMVYLRLDKVMFHEFLQPPIERLTPSQRRFYVDRLSFPQEAQALISNISSDLMESDEAAKFPHDFAKQREVSEGLKQMGLNDEQVLEVFQFFNIPYQLEGEEK